MVYLRGHPRDYDHWANVTGDNRWSYNNVLPFFLKSEDYCFQCENNPNDVIERESTDSIAIETLNASIHPYIIYLIDLHSILSSSRRSTDSGEASV